MTTAIDRILFLEDDELLLDAYSQIVEITQFKSVLFKSYSQFTEFPHNTLSTKIAFLDINLSDSNFSGIDACEWLIKNNYQGKIYFLTGHAFNDPRLEQFTKNEKVGLLKKPIEMNELIKLINQ